MVTTTVAAIGKHSCNRTVRITNQAQSRAGVVAVTVAEQTHGPAPAEPSRQPAVRSEVTPEVSLVVDHAAGFQAVVHSVSVAVHLAVMVAEVTDENYRTSRHQTV